MSSLKNLYRACIIYKDDVYNDILVIQDHKSNNHTFLSRSAGFLLTIPTISPKLGQISSKKV